MGKYRIKMKYIIFKIAIILLIISCKPSVMECDMEKLYNVNYRKKMKLPVLDGFVQEESEDWIVILKNKNNTKNSYLYESAFICRSQGEFFTFILDSTKCLRVDYGHFSNDISDNIHIDSLGVNDKKISIEDYKKIIKKYPSLQLPLPHSMTKNN